MKTLREYLHTYVPARFHDPFGLAWRIIRSGDRAALMAMGSSAGALALAPLDLALGRLEARMLDRAPSPRLPIVLICGPPRSGTTLVTQVLLDRLPFSYFNNITALFPRAPIIGMRLLGMRPKNAPIEARSYYGKSPQWHGPNDALYLWDRWFGSDRDRIPSTVDARNVRAMRAFFGAMEAAFGLPVLNKNNHLVTCAPLVADILPTARFICLRRDPLQLAQSLLKARLDIQGDPKTPYGVAPPPSSARPRSVAEDVVAQVRLYRRLMMDAQRRLPPERFWVVDYERFCGDPAALVRKVAREILERPEPSGRKPLKAFTPSRRPRVSAEQLRELEVLLSRDEEEEIHRPEPADS